MVVKRGIKGFVGNIEKATLKNNDFRNVVYTARHSQLVLMSLLPGEEIGLEVHHKNDQFFRFESGNGKVIINGHTYKVKSGTAIIVPSGSRHNVINVSATKKLKMYTIYSPPHHKEGVVRKTKSQAEKDSPEFDGKTSE